MRDSARLTRERLKLSTPCFFHSPACVPYANTRGHILALPGVKARRNFFYLHPRLRRGTIRMVKVN